MSLLVSANHVRVHLTAVCRTCKVRHNITCGPERVALEMADWEHKHPLERGCLTLYDTPKRVIPGKLDDRQYNRTGKGPWFLDYAENTNFNFAYRASTALTNALTSLGSSATWVAGYESAIIDNSSNKDFDILISLTTKVGSSGVTVGIIEISSVSMMDDSLWPDVFDGTTSAETITSVGVKTGICKTLGALNVDATSVNRPYYMSKQSLAALYGMVCPDKSVIFTAHNTTAALSGTAGDHVTTLQSVYIVGV